MDIKLSFVISKYKLVCRCITSVSMICIFPIYFFLVCYLFNYSYIKLFFFSYLYLHWQFLVTENLVLLWRMQIIHRSFKRRKMLLQAVHLLFNTATFYGLCSQYAVTMWNLVELGKRYGLWSEFKYQTSSSKLPHCM